MWVIVTIVVSAFHWLICKKMIDESHLEDGEPTRSTTPKPAGNGPGKWPHPARNGQAAAAWRDGGWLDIHAALMWVRVTKS